MSFYFGIGGFSKTHQLVLGVACIITLWVCYYVFGFATVVYQKTHWVVLGVPYHTRNRFEFSLDCHFKSLTSCISEEVPSRVANLS